MKQDQAIAMAKAFVAKHTGVIADPESARLIQRPGIPGYWSIVYAAGLFFPEDAAKGAVIDGPYVVRVDDVTGEVSVLG
jgi:hypothetical protein